MVARALSLSVSLFLLLVLFALFSSRCHSPLVFVVKLHLWNGAFWYEFFLFGLDEYVKFGKHFIPPSPWQGHSGKKRYFTEKMSESWINSSIRPFSGPLDNWYARQKGLQPALWLKFEFESTTNPAAYLQQWMCKSRVNETEWGQIASKKSKHDWEKGCKFHWHELNTITSLDVNSKLSEYWTHLECVPLLFGRFWFEKS